MSQGIPTGPAGPEGNCDKPLTRAKAGKYLKDKYGLGSASLLAAALYGSHEEDPATADAEQRQHDAVRQERIRDAWLER
jgi:hypothetical protein